MDKKHPSISIVMCVYNGEKYLGEAMGSLLEQTFRDFELIVVDDGSTDSTPQILDGYADPRIVRIRNPKNLGIPASCNIGLEAVRAPYIARMDADDVCTSDRLEVQYAYLQAQPDMAMLATSFTVIEPSGKVRGQSRIPEEPMLPWVMLWGNCIGQPSVMIRREALDRIGAYDPTMTYAEDYDLWCRFLMAGERVGTLDHVTFMRRKSPLRASEKHVTTDRCVGKISSRYLAWVLGHPIPENQLSAFLKFIRRNRDVTISDFEQAVRLVDEVYSVVLRKNDPTLHFALRDLFADQMFRWADLLRISRAPGGRQVLWHALRYKPTKIFSKAFWHEYRRSLNRC